MSTSITVKTSIGLLTLSEHDVASLISDQRMLLDCALVLASPGKAALNCDIPYDFKTAVKEMQRIYLREGYHEETVGYYFNL